MMWIWLSVILISFGGLIRLFSNVKKINKLIIILTLFFIIGVFLLV